MPRDGTDNREADLQRAVEEALCDAKLRDRALTLAVQQFNKTRLSINAVQITALADAFYKFLKGGPK
jgi:hypothetical protein